MRAITFLCFLFLIKSSLAFRCEVVSVLYNDDFEVGVRTLGQSLNDTNPYLHKTLLVTDDVSEWAIKRLRDQGGWNIEKATKLRNPHADEPGARSRLEFVFTKISIWNMEQFDRVIYLDADTLVTESIYELCQCEARICAVTRDVYFNAGVMVITPSKRLFNEMVSLYETTDSYNQGEQGFLNLVFPEFQRCSYLDTRSLESYAPEAYRFQKASISSFIEREDRLHRCYRLPALYNGDFGLYVARGDRWEVDPLFDLEHPKIIHYTLGPFKPWSWPSYLVGGEAYGEWFSTYKQTVSDSEFNRRCAAVVFLVILNHLIFVGGCRLIMERYFKGRTLTITFMKPTPSSYENNAIAEFIALIGFQLVGLTIASGISTWFDPSLHPLCSFIELWCNYLVIAGTTLVFYQTLDRRTLKAFVIMNLIFTLWVFAVLFIVVNYFSGVTCRVLALLLVGSVVIAANARFAIVRLRRRLFAPREPPKSEEGVYTDSRGNTITVARLSLVEGEVLPLSDKTPIGEYWRGSPEREEKEK